MPFGVLKRQGVAHLWPLGRACSASWDPIPRAGDSHQWRGYPQPLAGHICPARGLGPHYCATWAPIAGGSPPLQSMQIWRGFATGEQKNKCGPSTSGTIKVSPKATGVQLFFGAYPQRGRGGGYGKKNWGENFLRTPKREISLSLPHVFGFGRCREGIFQGNHGYFSRYGWYFCFRAERPPVCSGYSAATHPCLLLEGKSPQIRQYTPSGARNRTSNIEGQG